MEEGKSSQVYFQHCQELLHSIRILLRDESLLDVVLVCMNGERIRTSSILLNAVSTLLRDITKQIGDVVEEQYILLPDVPVDYMTCFLNKLLQWRALPSKNDLYMMYHVLETFGAQQDYFLPENIINTIELSADQPNIDSNKENSLVNIIEQSKPRKAQTFKTIYRCDKCMKQFRHKRDFMNHLNSHFGIKPFSCNQCGKCFTQKSHLNTHISIHSGIKKYVCYKCGRSFNVSSNLKKHLAVHYRAQNETEYQVEGELSPLPVQTENSEFIVSDLVLEGIYQRKEEDNINQSEYQHNSANHQQLGHLSDIQIHPANLTVQRSSDEQIDKHQSADFQLADQSESQQETVSGNMNNQSYIHILPLIKATADISHNHQHQQYRIVNVNEDHNETKSEERYSINQSQPPIIETDLVKETNANDQAYKCTFCIKAFKQKSHLNHHVRVKHLKGEHLEKYSCKQCESKFTSTNSLKHHMMLHDNNRPHKCSECNKTFVQASHLKLHMFQHKNDKPYLCVVCGKSFISKGRLNDHTKIHSGERKVFECEECTAKYFGLHDFKIHMRKHTGELPFQCEHCTKKFRSLRNRDIHQRIHTGEKPYLCRGCGKGYSSASSLHQHYIKSVNCKAIKMDYEKSYTSTTPTLLTTRI